MTDTVLLGRAAVTRVVETRIEMRTSLFAATPPEAWQDDADLLDPAFWDAGTDQWKIADHRYAHGMEHGNAFGHG